MKVKYKGCMIRYNEPQSKWIIGGRGFVDIPFIQLTFKEVIDKLDDYIKINNLPLLTILQKDHNNE